MLDFVEFDMQPDSSIYNFGYYDENLYVFVKDGWVYQLNAITMASVRMGGRIQTAKAPYIPALGRSIFSITATSRGVFLYSSKLDVSIFNNPVLTNYFQPFILADNPMDIGNVLPKAPATVHGLINWPYPLNLMFGDEIMLSKADWDIKQSSRYEYCNNILDPSKKGYLDFHADYIGTLPSNSSETKLGFIYNYHRAGKPVTTGNKLNVFSFTPNISRVNNQAYYFPDNVSQTNKIRYFFDPYYVMFNVNQVPDYWFIPSYGQYLAAAHYSDPVDIDAQQRLNWKIKHHPYFGYDSWGGRVADQKLYTIGTFFPEETGSISRDIDTCFYLYYKDDNVDFFSAGLESFYVLLVGFDYTGEYLGKEVTPLGEGKRTWRYILPLGQIADAADLPPINSLSRTNDVRVYAGTEMTRRNNRNYGWYFEYHIDNHDIFFSSMDISVLRHKIWQDGRWLSLNYSDQKFYLSDNFDLAGKVYGLNDYTDFESNRSNLVSIDRTIITEVAGSITTDKIKILGSPDPPSVQAARDVSSTLVSGTRLSYHLVFQFFGGKTTALSLPSMLITVPNADTKIIITRINLEDIQGIDIYNRDDIEFILLYRRELAPGLDIEDENFTEPNLIAQFEKDGNGDWFYGLPTPPYPKETFEDNAASYAYNPFDETQETNYQAVDFFVHKNRLVLLKAQSVIQYSDTDNAKAIPDANTRPVSSGDEAREIAGISAGDYAYIFKTKKIYAILGDVRTGQIIDVSTTVGTRYKNMKSVHNDIVYFLNDDSIYRLRPGAPPEDINGERVENYFDTKRDDCIDFENLDDHGFAYTDVEKKEVRFYVPQKVNNLSQESNNLCIIYNIQYNYFRTAKYFHDISDEVIIENLKSNERQILMADYEGNIFNRDESKNDDGKEIEFIIRTKEFNLNLDTIAKIYKVLKVAGDYLTDLYVTYWIDGERYRGDVLYSNQEEWIKLWSSKGRAKRIMIEFSGKKLNQPPTYINEIALGATKAKGFK
jgi:hypothetical protein